MGTLPKNPGQAVSYSTVTDLATLRGQSTWNKSYNRDNRRKMADDISKTRGSDQQHVIKYGRYYLLMNSLLQKYNSPEFWKLAKSEYGNHTSARVQRVQYIKNTNTHIEVTDIAL